MFNDMFCCHQPKCNDCQKKGCGKDPCSCGSCKPVEYSCDFDIEADPYNSHIWNIIWCGRIHKVSIPKIAETCTRLSIDYSRATLNYIGECGNTEITGKQLGSIINVEDLRNTCIDYSLPGNCYEFIYHKDIHCGEGCKSPEDCWSNFNIFSDGALKDGIEYIRGAGDDGCPEYLKKPTVSCSYLVFEPNCDGSGKWKPHHIPDAGECIMEPNSKGYYEVLTKDDCGCIKECQMPAAGIVSVNYIRDSVPDDPDYPWYYGNYNETINLKLQEKVPSYFGKYPLKITITYTMQCVKSSVYNYNFNYRSILAPILPGESARQKVENTASLLQGNATFSENESAAGKVFGGIPWGTQAQRGILVFIVPKGQEASLRHEFRIITNESAIKYALKQQSDLWHRTGYDGQQVPPEHLSRINNMVAPASRLNAVNVIIEPMSIANTNYRLETGVAQLDPIEDASPNPY